MDAHLIRDWLGDAAAIAVRDDASISVVREEVRRHGAEVGLGVTEVESLAGAASELAHNVLRHARGGQVAVRPVRRAGVGGVEVVAADRGAGIADPTDAMRGAARVGGGLGVGLSAAYRLSDEMDVDVRWGEGSCVWARKFAAPVARSELAILGRAYAGEAVSGDHAAFVRGEDALTLCVVDGLGHGEPAREAAFAAVREVRAAADRALVDVLARCDAALDGTRGAVMALARVDLRSGELEHTGAGNIATRVLERDGNARALLSVARVLGLRQRGGRFAVERVAGAKRLLAMWSDGLSSRVDLAGEAELLRQPPLVIAHHLMGRFGRTTDDATVLVARLP